MNKSFLEANADTIKTQLKELAKGIKQSNDPEALESFRKLIKKSLSFTERKYLAAYILINHESLLGSSQWKKSGSFSANQKNAALQKGKHPSSFKPYPIDNEKKEKKKAESFSKKVSSSNTATSNFKEPKSIESKPGEKTLFISIGKNRKVFPADLQNLFIEALGVDASQLGRIKIFPKYSFINLPDSLCNIAIDKLSNTEFHGIKIKVNYSKSTASSSNLETTPSEQKESLPITEETPTLE